MNNTKTRKIKTSYKVYEKCGEVTGYLVGTYTTLQEAKGHYRKIDAGFIKRTTIEKLASKGMNKPVTRQQEMLPLREMAKKLF